ncbi:MAG: DUF4097 family beta strand repeat protein [Tenericutes bacterium]|nr:DUF4097 family beta strand repeat protein [Mycoplasmatota bacterium]
MKKFMKMLEEELQKSNLNDGEIEEILADHEEMINSAISEGLTNDEIVEKFGDPKNLVEELSQFSDKKDSEEPTDEEDSEESTDEKVFGDVKENYEVSVKLINEDIDFYIHEANEIKVQYFGHRNLKRYTVEFVNNKLIIERPKGLNIGLFSRDNGAEFNVYLPKGINVHEFMLKTVNGDLEVKGLTADQVEIQATNGDLEIENFQSIDFKVTTVNGDIEVNNVSCEEFIATVVSGDIEISELACKNDVYMNTVSGDIEINNSTCTEATLKTVSGDLEGKEFYPKVVSLKSVSGDIDIHNKDKSKKIQIKTSRSVSGEISIS